MHRFQRLVCLLLMTCAVLMFSQNAMADLKMVVTSLSLDGSTLDVDGGDVIVRTPMISQIVGWIHSGMDGKDSGGLTTWNGTGIVTSTGRAANLVAGYDRYSLGAVLNGDFTTMGIDPAMLAFDGVAVSDTNVLIKYTLNGDANLDGLVNMTDYQYWLKGSQGGTGVTDWINGDFNYDGVTDYQDLAILQSNGVPEPCSLTLLGIGAVALALGTWRRRR